MKKIFLILLSICSILLVSCTKEKEETKKVEIKFAQNPITLCIGEKCNIEYELINGDSYIVSFEYTDESRIIRLKNETITALKLGETSINVFIESNDELLLETLRVIVTKDNIAPTFSSSLDLELINVSWGSKPDQLAIGLTATDNIDGDITSKIQIDDTSFNNKKYGEQTISYTVTDSSGNTSIFTRKVNVIWDYSVQFIGHAGSYYGVSNTEEAIIYAAKILQYHIIEVDLRQTKDGVFVLCHDPDFGGIDLASTNYADIKDVEVTSNRNSGYPAQYGTVTNSPYTSKICTLERFLEICKEYNVIPLIELKDSKGITNSDQSRMQALMDEIERLEMLDKVMFLASAYNCLIWTRNNNYEFVPCQYLVGSCESETTLQRCIDYNFDISFNTTYGDYSNSEEWIKKYKDAGLKVSTYTYTQYSDYNIVQEWINKGVDYVTCDWHQMDKLNLPKNE